MELVNVDGFRFSVDTIARVLRITESDAKVAVERLVRLKLIFRDEKGHWKRIKENIQVRSHIKNEAMRKFYLQMMKKASKSLESQTPDQRLSGYETLSICPEALPEMRGALDRFFEEIYRISGKHVRRTKVYHLLVHGFNLTESKWTKGI